MIARMWRGWVRTPDRDAYVAYIERTGMAEYRQTPGNRGAYMLARDLGEDRTEIITLSFWESAASDPRLRRRRHRAGGLLSRGRPLSRRPGDDRDPLRGGLPKLRSVSKGLTQAR